jgi:hypothetical protein
MIAKRCEVPPHRPGHGRTQAERTRHLFDLRQDTPYLGASDRTSKRYFQPGDKQLRLAGQQPIHIIAGYAAVGRTITAEDLPNHFVEPLKESRKTKCSDDPPFRARGCKASMLSHPDRCR